MLAIINFFNFCIARSTTPVPVCSLGVLYSISKLFDLEKSLYSLEKSAPPSSVLIFSGSPYKLKICFEKFNTSFVSDDFRQIFMVGHLLNLSITISICSPFSFLRFNFPGKNRFEFLVPVPLMFSVFRSYFLVVSNLDSYPKPCRPYIFWFCPQSQSLTCLATRIFWLRLTSL